MGTSNWPKPGTSTWPPADTFSRPRTIRGTRMSRLLVTPNAPVVAPRPFPLGRGKAGRRPLTLPAAGLQPGIQSTCRAIETAAVTALGVLRPPGRHVALGLVPLPAQGGQRPRHTDRAGRRFGPRSDAPPISAP